MLACTPHIWKSGGTKIFFRSLRSRILFCTPHLKIRGAAHARASEPANIMDFGLNEGRTTTEKVVFRSRRNVISDGAFLTDDGKLFHARAEATGKHIAYRHNNTVLIALLWGRSLYYSNIHVTYGKWSLAYAGPSAWNSLPDDLRNTPPAFQLFHLNSLTCLLITSASSALEVSQ